MTTIDAQPANSSRKGYRYWSPPNVQPSKSRWTSENITTFLSACVSQHRAGNRGLMYLNNKGWDGLIETFYNITGIYYDQKQMKNKWDSLKKEYTSWLYLKNPQNGCTGMGWDVAKNTVTALAFWWESIGQRNKICLKFKDKGIENESMLADLFDGKMATGENQWTPSENVFVVSELERDYNDFETEVSKKEIPNVGNKNENIPNSDSAGRVRKMSNVDNATINKKKRQSPTTRLNNTLERVIASVEYQQNEITIKHYADSIKATVADCLEKLGQLPGIVEGDDLYMFSTELLEIASLREMFMGLRTDEIRVSWLKMKRAKVTSHVA